MKSDVYRPVKAEQPEPKHKTSGSERRMIERTKKWKPDASPKLREVYSTKIEWVQRVIPRVAKEAGAVEKIL